MLPMPRFLLCLAAMALLSACSGTKSTAPIELTQNDKHLNCTELQLDIIEASFLRDKAERNRGLNMRNVLLPLSYPSTYLSADSAVEAARNRIEYLTRLSEVKGCGASDQRYASLEQVNYTPPPPPAGREYSF